MNAKHAASMANNTNVSSTAIQSSMPTGNLILAVDLGALHMAA